MIDPNPAELAAIDDASERAGEFIAEHGHDLSKWSRDTWQSFIGCICGGYIDSVLEKQVTANHAASKVINTQAPF